MTATSIPGEDDPRCWSQSQVIEVCLERHHLGPRPNSVPAATADEICKGIAERFSELRLEVLQPEYRLDVLFRSLKELPVSFSERCRL